MPDEFDGRDDYVEYLEEVAENVDDFEELYGFKHDCHCKEDWEEGDVGLVSKCYTQMTNDALNQCHKLKGEAAALTRLITILEMQVRELGGEPRIDRD